MALKDLAFGLSLKSDSFDRGMQKARSQLQALAKQRLAGLKAELQQITKEGKTLNKTKFKSLVSEYKNLQATMRKTASEARKTTSAVKGGFSTLKNMLGTAGGMFMFKAGGGILNAVQDFASGMIRQNSELEKASATFEALAGNAEKAKEVMSALRTEADKTPFDTAEMIEAGKALMPMAKGSTQTMMRLMKTAEVMASFNPQMGLKGAAEALKDAASGEMERMKEFGVSSSSIKGVGGTKPKDIVEAASLVDKVYKSMGIGYDLVEKQARTFEGLMSTVKSFLTEIQRVIGEKLFDTLKQKLISASKWIEVNKDKVFEQAKKVGEWVNNAFVTVYQSFNQMIAFVSGGGLEQVWERMMQVVKGIWMNVMKDIFAWGEWVGNHIAEKLSAIITDTWNNIKQAPGEALKKAWDWNPYSTVYRGGKAAYNWATGTQPGQPGQPNVYRPPTASDVIAASANRWGNTFQSWSAPLAASVTPAAPNMVTSFAQAQAAPVGAPNALPPLEQAAAQADAAYVQKQRQDFEKQLAANRPTTINVTSLGGHFHPVSAS